MILTIALMLQAGPPAPVTVTPRTTAKSACRLGGDEDAIVVCGRKDAAERYRLRPLPDVAEARLLPKAETAFAGGVLSAETEAATMPGGQISKRAMIRYKLKF